MDADRRWENCRCFSNCRERISELGGQRFGPSFPGCLDHSKETPPRSKADFGTVEIAKEQLHGGFGASELTQTRCGMTESELFLRILGIGLSSTVSLFYAREMRHCSERDSKFVYPFAN
ncbi:hypothetical protein TNCV_2409851 [Trichonephila clavipes]|nr:hypothetical protein TNCV_2409851 [Trichonephila clavipes]